MEEIWKDVVGYTGSYIVSNYGKVKRLIGWQCKKERILSPCKTKRGYFRVGLYKNNLRKTYLVHRLVMEAFDGPCPKNMEICHNDQNPGDNQKENLRYDTRKNNGKDKIKHRTCFVETLELLEKGTLKPEEVLKYFRTRILEFK